MLYLSTRNWEGFLVAGYCKNDGRQREDMESGSFFLRDDILAEKASGIESETQLTIPPAGKGEEIEEEDTLENFHRISSSFGDRNVETHMPLKEKAVPE